MSALKSYWSNGQDLGQDIRTALADALHSHQTLSYLSHQPAASFAPLGKRRFRRATLQQELHAFFMS